MPSKPHLGNDKQYSPASVVTALNCRVEINALGFQGAPPFGPPGGPPEAPGATFHGGRDSSLKTKRRRQLVTIFCVAVTLLFCGGCKDIAFNNPLDPDASKEVLEIIRVMDTQLLGGGDLAFDGEKIWKAGNFGDLTAVDMESGITIRTFATGAASGVCFFGDALHLCGASGENILEVIDPLSGDVLNRISTTGIYPGFLAVSGGQMLVYDTRSSGIFSYEPGTGLAERLFDVSGINIGGIALYRNSLLVSDMNTDTVYRFSLAGGVLEVLSSPASGIGGLTVDDEDYVYIFTMDGKIYKVSLPGS
ncbi:MAG: hypothetical protein GY765_00645 [bacterium]|nr:hypothetical protein [bacterium]